MWLLWILRWECLTTKHENTHEITSDPAGTRTAVVGTATYKPGEGFAIEAVSSAAVHQETTKTNQNMSFCPKPVKLYQKNRTSEPFRSPYYRVVKGRGSKGEVLGNVREPWGVLG